MHLGIGSVRVILCMSKQIPFISGSVGGAKYTVRGMMGKTENQPYFDIKEGLLLSSNKISLYLMWNVMLKLIQY